MENFAILRGNRPLLLRAFSALILIIMSIWSYCRSRFADGGPWLFGNFSITDAMYAPVVMRLRSVDVALTADVEAYCATMNACPSVAKWITLALAEEAVVPADELDWPSELLKR